MTKQEVEDKDKTAAQSTPDLDPLRDNRFVAQPGEVKYTPPPEPTDGES